MNERKFGWREKGILGMIFSPLGAFFLLLGLVLYSAGAGHQPEDSKQQPSSEMEEER